MLLLLLLVVLLHRHDGAHGIRDILAAAMRHYPCMRIVGYGIPSRLAFHGRTASSCVTCCFHIVYNKSNCFLNLC